MNSEILNQLPYSSIKQLIELRDYFTAALIENEAIIYEQKSNESILYQFIDKISGYTFVVRGFEYIETSKTNIFNIHKRPWGIENVKGDSQKCNLEKLITFFEKWIEDIKTLNEIKFNYLNPNGKFYDEQFEDFFTNDDDDALVNPFEIDRQEVLYHFLTYAEKQIAKAGIENETKGELIDDISQLKEKIPNVPKKRVVLLLSKFAQKTKKVSNKLFHEIFDVLKKEVIKSVLYKTSSQLPNAISTVEKWIHLL